MGRKPFAAQANNHATHNDPLARIRKAVCCLSISNGWWWTGLDCPNAN